jgi:hypothetical protein
MSRVVYTRYYQHIGNLLAFGGCLRNLTASEGRILPIAQKQNKTTHSQHGCGSGQDSTTSYIAGAGKFDTVTGGSR